MNTTRTDITKNLLVAALQYCKGEGTHPTPLPELSVIRREKRTQATLGMYTPSVCFVLQGEKIVWSGN